MSWNCEIRRWSLKWFVGLAASMLALAGAAEASGKISHPEGEPLQALLEEFEAYAAQGMKDWQVPGMAVAIVRGDRTIYKHGFGVKRSGSDDRVETSTLFRIGSTSKAFTAALVAMLVDEGKVKWNDRVVDHLPDFRLHDPWVTENFLVWDLMAQHSGMPAYAADSAAMVGFGREHIVRSMQHIRPTSSFRSEFAYVNNLWVVAGNLVERHTGQSWEENVRERIFKPLGMAGSSLDLKSFLASDNAAWPHRLVDHKLEVLDKNLNWTYVYGPAGGINSNVEQMTRWVRLQIHYGKFEGRQLISEQSVRFMHSPKTVLPPTAKEDPQYYGQGWMWRGSRPYPIIWHNGGTSGMHTMVALVPQAELGMVVLSNNGSVELPEALAYQFFDTYFGKTDADWSAKLLQKTAEAEKKAASERLKQPENPSPPLPLESYAGKYRNPIYEEIEVAVRDGSLVVMIGPDREQIPLAHWSRDSFRVCWWLVAGETCLARFEIDAQGSRAIRLTLDPFNEDGCGVFDRVEETPKQ